MARQRDVSLPAWQYMVGVFLSTMPVALDFIEAAGPVVSTLPIKLLVPFVFGIWVGIKHTDSLRWVYIATVALQVSVGSFIVAVTGLRFVSLLGVGPIELFEYSGLGVIGFGITYAVVPAFMVVSGAVIGNAFQRRAWYVAARLAAQPSTGSGNWTPRKQVLWGVGGSIVGSVIGVIGQGLIEVYIKNGG